MDNQSRRILLVDDDPDDYILTRDLLEEAERQPFNLEWASTLEEGWKVLEDRTFDAVLIDYDLGPRTGLDLVRQAAAGGYSGPMILLTGHDSYDLDLAAMQAGAVDFLNKNEVTPALLERAIRYAVERKQAENILADRNLELEKARAELEDRVQERTRELRQANTALEEAIDQLERANIELAERSSELTAANLELEHANTELKEEIQERQRVEAELRERTARLDLILDEIPAVLWSTDRELSFTSASGKGLLPLGLLPDQLVGQPVASLIQAEAESSRTVFAHQLALEGRVASFEAQIRDRTYRTHVAPLHDAVGQISGTIGVALDITENIQAEQAFRESQQRLRTVVELAPVMLWSVDLDLRLTLMEGQAVTVLGIDPEELLGQSLEDHLSRRPDLMECLQQALSGDQAMSIAPSLFNPEHFLETHYVPYRTQDGQITGVIGVSTLVTERVQDQARLAYQARLLENVTDAIVASDASFRVTAWNPAAEELFGWPAEAVIGQPLAEVLPFQESEASPQEIIAQLRESGRDSAERIAYQPDGRQVLVETRTIALREESGQVTGYVSVHRDISERKKAEALLKARNEELAARTAELSEANQQLQESQALFESLFDSAPDTMLLTDRAGVILRANRRALENFGFLQAELAGQAVEVLLADPLRATYSNLRDTYFRNPQVQPIQLDLELSGLRKDGSQFPIDITLSPLRQGSEMQVIHVIRDVTRRKLAEGALRESEARFRTVFEGSAMGIALKDLEGHILTTNPALSEMLGYAPAELRNRRFDELTDPLDVPAENRLFEQLSKGLVDRYELEKRYLHKDGHSWWARVVVSVIKDEFGHPQFAIFMVENIHDRKLMEAELVEVRRRLMDSREEERMELARDLHDGPMQELYGVVFQLGELQTELAVAELPAALQPAEDGNGRSEEPLPLQLEGLRTHVLGTIQELRGFCGALRPPTLTPFGLEATLRAHAEGFQEEHPEIEVQLDLQPDGLALPERVRVALFRIYQQSLVNILRHARATNIAVRFALDEKEINLEIQDNGQGFTVPRRWIDFVRAGHLGLAGAAERAEAIGGRLAVQSAPGQGTLLRVTVPREGAGVIIPQP